MRRARSRRRAAELATVAVAVALARLFPACDDPRSHVYSARKYDERLGCIGFTEAIEVIDGPDVSRDCAPTCVVVGRLRDGASTLFVSTTCPPHPAGEPEARTDPRCAPALEAFQRGNLCLPDGGSAASPDAAADASAADASADAAADASAADASADAAADASADALTDAPDDG